MSNITGWSASAQATITAPTLSEWMRLERKLVAEQNAVSVPPRLAAVIDPEARLAPRPRKRLSVPRMALGDRTGGVRW